VRARAINTFVLCLVFLCHGQSIFAQTPDPEKVAKSQLTFKCIEAEEGTFGYDIYSDGKKLIHQPTIPGATGTLGFRSKKDSEKVALLVIEKLKKKVMPPTVSQDELMRLQVIE
jgi:hypothetical protein